LEGKIMSLISIENLSHSFGEKKIFANTGFRLLPGDKMGLTGANGSGKSTLVNILSGALLPDEGVLEKLPKVRVGCLDQQAHIDPALTVRGYLRTAFETLFETERELDETNAAMAGCPGAELDRLVSRSARLQRELEQGGFYDVDSRIAKVANGLGVAAYGLDTSVGRLSGGQRAKLLLAKLLLEAPDVLLLDEPTNFLDAAHIEWLARYLKGFAGAFVLVSHDPAFLSAVVNCVCDIEFCAITRYSGAYESFQSQKAQRKEEYVRLYERQQAEIAKLEDYIARNIVRASTTKMAQSRRKKLNKIERLERPKALPVPSFSFTYKPVSDQVLLEVRALTVGYDRPLLRGIDLKVKKGEKIAVKGFNGIGKTTFLKTITGAIPALGGMYAFAEGAEAGCYEQEHAWADANATPVQEILGAYPRLDARDARKWLARCGLKQEHADRKLKLLSGGEQAKVKLCRLMMRPHSILLLDEPTNHLDAAAKEALKEVLKAFEGGVVLVSHDEEFYADIATKVFNVERLLGK
jgi:ATPase subunit of ABC transporter with duplicated ATPase domains